MGTSIVNIQHDIILEAVRTTAGREWKILIVDEASRKLIDNVIKEDAILRERVTSIEQIENKRAVNQDIDALYFLSPEPHIVDCLMADFERRRYRRSFLLWTSILDPKQRERLERSQMARQQIAGFRILNINFFPRESHVVTFRDPWSMPVLFHPGCNHLIRGHLQQLAQKIVSVCVSLGEYPTIRYYRPRTPAHEASVLCSHLARFVQDELDEYAQANQDFPPPSPRPRGVLYILDRSMDLMSPLLHEFTYQAMAHDLLPIKDGEKITYKTVINEGAPNQAMQDMDISEEDKIWVENRHLHMKDLLGKLVDDFNKFRAQNPDFAGDGSAATVSTIRNMMAGLTDFQEGKNAYTLHLNMAQECMKHFQEHNLLEVSSVEQCLSTGLDEDYKKPKNLASQLVRLLDNEAVGPPDRLRLILQYILYRDGLLGGDITKLLAHAQLPPQDGNVISNLELLGARVEKPLKDTKPAPQPLFPKKPVPATVPEDDSSLSRFEPNVKLLLEGQMKGTLDPTIFPSTRPHADGDGMSGPEIVQTSLRSAKPTWARTRPVANEPRQRIIVFMAGGATFSEARTCYEVSHAAAKDVILATSHMLTPGLFLRQMGDLSVDRRRLDIPAERPKPKAPAHLFERELPPQPPAPRQPPPPRSPAPPTAAMANMNMGPGQVPNGRSNGPSAAPPAPTMAPAPAPTPYGGKPPKKEKEKKKHHFFR